MFILRKLPLTTSALALVTAYSVFKISIKSLRQLRNRPNNVQDPMSSLPLDMQQEIISHFFDPVNAQDIELLYLSLTCKYWHKFISEHSAWLKERLPYKVNEMNAKIAKDENLHYYPNSEIDLLGADALFSPKMAYFVVLGRTFPRRESHYSRFSSELKRPKSDQLYVPWINHNLIQRPETFWQFIKTILIAPEWLYPFIVLRVAKGISRITDRKFRKRIFPLSSLLAILLSLLPFLDSLLFRPDALISHIKTAFMSKNILHHLLWEMKPWSFATFFRTALNLLPLQFFENSFGIDNGELFIVRLGLIALLSLISIGPLFPQLVLGGSGLLLTYLCKTISSKDIRFVLVVAYLAPWMFYYGPLKMLFLAAAIVLAFLDLFYRGLRRPSKDSKKIRRCENNVHRGYSSSASKSALNRKIKQSSKCILVHKPSTQYEAEINIRRTRSVE